MKNILLLAVILVLWVMPGMQVSAVTKEEILAQSGADSIEVDKQTRSFLESQSISFTDPQSVLTLSPKELLCSMWNTFRSQCTAPLRLFFTLALVVVCAVLTSGLGDTISERGLSDAYGFLVVMVTVSVLLTPMEQCFSLVSETMESGSRFMLCFAPVLSSILAAGGCVVSASVYQVAVFSLAELAVQLSRLYLLPLLRILLALAVMDAVHPDLSFGSIIRGIRQAAQWGLGLMMAVFVGLQTVQGVVSASADTVATKATKFMLSSCVPVVGGAVSDAYTTLRGSVGVLRSGIGSVGMIALGAMVLPPLILLGLYRLAVLAAGTLAELSGVRSLSKLLHSLEQVLSLALGMLCTFVFLLLLTTAIVLIAGGTA